jgi:hypothetical protein
MINNKQIHYNSVALRFALKLEAYVQHNMYSDFKLDTKLDWARNRTSSRGGIYKNGPGINIAMYSTAMLYHDPKHVYRFYEYPSYDSDKTIGGFYARDTTLKLEAVIAHEVAHAIQFFEYKKLSTRCKPHGPKFKQHYKLLRQLFINDRLPEQSALITEYNKLLSTLNVVTYKVA